MFAWHKSIGSNSNWFLKLITYLTAHTHETESSFLAHWSSGAASANHNRPFGWEFYFDHRSWFFFSPLFPFNWNRCWYALSPISQCGSLQHSWSTFFFFSSIQYTLCTNVFFSKLKIILYSFSSEQIIIKEINEKLCCAAAAAAAVFFFSSICFNSGPLMERKLN